MSAPATAYILESIRAALKAEAHQADALVDLLLKARSENRRIFLYGVGRSGLVAKAFAIRLVQLDYEVFFVGETTTPLMRAGDVVLLISNTGQTMSAVQTANIARRLGAEVVTITAHRESKLAQASSQVLQLAPQKEGGKAHFAPLGTLFEDATLILLDGVAGVLMERLGETESKLRSRHAIWV